MLQRRHLITAAGLAGLGACATSTTPPNISGSALPARARVVVIGGGFGGATAAKYLRLFSDHRVEVVLIEPDAAFISCPISNLVLGGSRSLAELTVPYTRLQNAHGVRHVRDSVARIDAASKQVVLASGPTIGYDKLIVSPGVDLNFSAIDGLAAAHQAGIALHAWKAGAETDALRRQLVAMPDGGVYAISIPEAPYRCPPGPYERASVIAAYFKANKPRSKVIVLDANPDVTSKPALFKKVWADDYAGLLEYRPLHKLQSVDGARRTLHFELHDDLQADVINVLPPMRAGAIALQSGLANVGTGAGSTNGPGGRWAGVDYQTFESTSHADIHVIGDAVLAAPAMPKSGHMANNHAKVAAAAVIARLADWEIDPEPMLANTCYSFVDMQRVVHVASVHTYVAAEKTYKPVAGAGGLSAGPTLQEGQYAWHWARTIWADMLA